MPIRSRPAGARSWRAAGVMSGIGAHDTMDPSGRSQPTEPAIQGLTLRFPPDLERRFHEDYFQKSVVQVRIGQIVGALVYGAFAIIDPWVIPDVASQVWALRTVIIACFGLLFAATFGPNFRRYWQPAVAGMVLVAGLSMIVVLIIA